MLRQDPSRQPNGTAKTDVRQRPSIPARAATPRRPVLIILHQETSSPGRVGNALRARGYPLDIRRPRFGDPLPETLDEHGE